MTFDLRSFWRRGPTDTSLRRERDELRAFLDAMADPNAMSVALDPGPPDPRLMAATIAEWVRMGEEDPLWSNDPEDEWRRENVDATALARFYDPDYVDTILRRFETRNGIRLAGGRCLDFGAGAGRAIPGLARRFDHVTAMDISPKALAYGRDVLTGRGIANVRYTALTKLDDIAADGPYDVIFSRRALACNPPPVQDSLVRRLLSALAPGGYAVFDTPNFVKDYRYRTERYLAEGKVNATVHAFPFRFVAAGAEDRGARILDIDAEVVPPFFQAFTYLVLRGPAGDSKATPPGRSNLFA